MRISPHALLLAPALLSAQVRTTRTTSGDTTVVSSVGLEPAAATRRIREVLTFGRESGPDHYTFGRITGARVGYDGTLWVFDAQVPALRQYDTAGTFIKQVGRGGQGPGEYPSLLSYAPMPDGGIVIRNREASRISNSCASFGFRRRIRRSAFPCWRVVSPSTALDASRRS
jgi:hypothetical protein